MSERDDLTEQVFHGQKQVPLTHGKDWAPEGGTPGAASVTDELMGNHWSYRPNMVWNFATEQQQADALAVKVKAAKLFPHLTDEDKVMILRGALLAAMIRDGQL